MAKFDDAFDKKLALWHVRGMAKCYAHNNGNMTPREAISATQGTHWNAEARLEIIDALTGCHGVEAFETWNGWHSYANSGDSYATTVVLSPNGVFRVCCIGDILETRRASRWAELHG